MARRRIRALAVVLVAVAVLTGCSVAPEWAIRLNADGTVDHLLCWGGMESISVDYRSSSHPSGIVEWEAEVVPTPVDDFSAVAKPVDVAYYGETPPNWSGDPARRPPVDWDYVSIGWGELARDELEVGEWHWEVRTDWAWIPPQPCDGWLVGADGEPRKVS